MLQIFNAKKKTQGFNVDCNQLSPLIGEVPILLTLLYSSRFFHHDVVELCDGYKRSSADWQSPACFPNLCYFCLGWDGILFLVRFSSQDDFCVLITAPSAPQDHWLVSCNARFECNAYWRQ